MLPLLSSSFSVVMELPNQPKLHLHLNFDKCDHKENIITTSFCLLIFLKDVFVASVKNKSLDKAK